MMEITVKYEVDGQISIREFSVLKIDVDQATQTLLLEPEEYLAKQDFKSLAQQFDPLIKESGNLNGVVHACNFPGWDSFASFVAQIQFVNGHHKHLKKVALCTDALFGTLVEKLGAHFVALRSRFFHIMT
jgi:hypothetical protein